MSRIKIVAGNWKMNNDATQSSDLLNALKAKKLTVSADKKVIIAPPFIYLKEAVDTLKDVNGFAVAAQNCHHENSGAFTGEVSATMLKSIGCEYVILGHSERREYNHESDALLAKKVDTALAAGLKVIFCCGEALEIREANTQNDFISNQIEKGIFHLSAEQLQHVVIAYEPIWAIGTGKTASAAQAQDMHTNIRQHLAHKYGADSADKMTILYGGSCNAQNASELFSQKDIDGGLIGGASLKADDFATIINAR